MLDGSPQFWQSRTVSELCVTGRRRSQRHKLRPEDRRCRDACMKVLPIVARSRAAMLPRLPRPSATLSTEGQEIMHGNGLSCRASAKTGRGSRSGHDPDRTRHWCGMPRHCDVGHMPEFQANDVSHYRCVTRLWVLVPLKPCQSRRDCSTPMPPEDPHRRHKSIFASLFSLTSVHR